jgi:hypothetical protein
MFACSFATLDQAYGDDRMSLDKIKADVEEEKRIKKEKEEQRRIAQEKEKEEQRRIAQEKEEKRRKKNHRIMRRFMRVNDGIWKHPHFNCYIPVEIMYVPSKDRVNKCSLMIKEDGTYDVWETLVGRIGGSDWTEEEYLKEYCITGVGEYTDNYYFTGNYRQLDLKSLFKYVCDDYPEEYSEESDFESEPETDEENKESDSGGSDNNKLRASILSVRVI